MLFAGEDGLENIDPNEQARQTRRERNAAMTEEDKEKRRAKDRENYQRKKSKNMVIPVLESGKTLSVILDSITRAYS